MLQRHRNRYTRLPTSTPERRFTRRRLIFIVFAFLATLALAIPVFLSHAPEYMRLCVPLNLTRVSDNLHRAVACSPVSAPAVLAASSRPSKFTAAVRISTLSRTLTTTAHATPVISTTTSITSATSSATAFSATTPAIVLASSFSTTPTTQTIMTSAPVVPGRLADWLLSQKESFLADLAAGRGKGWLIAVGNEAGDLDTIASSIAYAYLAASLQAQRVIPVILTPRKFMHLRPENFLALAQSHIPSDVLLHLEDLPVKASDLLSTGVGFVLVDHNRLLPIFGTTDAAYAAVRAIIDHHEDEGVSLQASPRIVTVPNGSSTSLVALSFQDEWRASAAGPAGAAGSPVPPEVATLLLSALLIDTQGLKEGGKATELDMRAAEFLYPLSSLAPAADVSLSATDTGAVPASLAAFSSALIDAKYDVSGMGEHDLLLRDYKEYPWDTSSAVSPRLVVGLCTVPVKIEKMLKHEGGWANFLAIADAYMAERKLDILGIGTTWKNSAGKGRRELLISVRAGGALPDFAAAQRALAALDAGLSADVETFALETWKFKDEAHAPPPALLDAPTRITRVWRQGNAHSTRKQLAPAMHRIVAALS
ncbi:DHH phosphoesterase [Cutaneotrichosporon oleaginosum]|uniref:DHH phosphoesterase n=1 Tax=Cutaneotrichosporon oleaginosum TaxID=879819 RepID=A0A0J0XVL9_9TREE|nr:DHH phosphoesterase [Cutaneotrichosporon oleaginosum]KLT45122.1 DHH phosphoesterase [Cutaneotrichosporon oleaginosum]TXT09802.1 hypothetical protein COLE_03736 [Cutaneotrichosporon oleaginosum]